MKTSKPKMYVKKQATQETLNLAKFSFENPNPVLQFSDKGVLIYSNAASDAFLEMCDADTRSAFMKDALRMIKEAGSVRLQKLIEIDCNRKTYSFVVIHIPETNNINLYGQDITERKNIANELEERETKLNKLNRILIAHAKSNRARLQISDEAEYLKEVCRIITEDCGHPLVWIGFALDDAEKNVRPVAFAGIKEVYLNMLHVTWADNILGQGPTGTAIRTGTIAICKNMQTDPKFAPWRKEAKKYSYNSAVAFPLLAKGKAFGAITLYAEKQESFEEDEVTMLAGLIHDISNGIMALRLESSQKKDQEALHRSEERYRSLFSQMTEAFALYEIIENKNGAPINYRFLEVNAAFEKITGLKREDILFKLQSSIIPGEDPRFLKIYGAVAKSGIPARFTNYSRILGKLYDIVAFSPENGQVATIFNDITGKKQEEEAKNNFIAIMAHELRNPLMPIFTNTELLNAYLLESAERGHPVDPKIKESVGVIIRQTQTLTRLLDDLLDISRIIRGQITLKKNSIDIFPSVQNAVEATLPLIESQKHTFSFSPPSSPIYINADPIRIEQVITDLLNNAAKYTKSGGHISLTIKEVGAIVEIKVKDTGVGIKQSDINKIFGLFIQFSKPFVETSGDFGLGLKIIKDIIALHNGTIEVKSDGLNQGSEFIVRLPTDPVQTTLEFIKKLETPKNEAVAEKRKILVVDDNKDISSSLGRILAYLGHEIKTANDGAGALSATEYFKPEMAILDIGLPDMSGHQLAREFRKKYGKTVMLVALTGYGQEKDKLLSKEAGFDYHLTKPVSIDDINKIIEKIFPRID
jgi:PAS domain S-box-containing protein